MVSKTNPLSLYKFHNSWLVVLFLIVWSFNYNIISLFYPNYSGLAALWWGIVAAAIYLLSIVFHELGHLFASITLKAPLSKRIILPYGGVSYNKHSLISLEKESIISLSGPLSSIIAACLSYLLYIAGSYLKWPGALLFILDYMASLNIILTGLNLLPASPLDGGNVLMSALVQWGKCSRLAFKISTLNGHLLSFSIAISGIIFIYRGSLSKGIWCILIGIVLGEGISICSKKNSIRKALEGEKVGDYLRPNPVTVSSNLSLNLFVKDYLYRYHSEFFPVKTGNSLSGCISSSRIREIPLQNWDKFTVSDLADPLNETNSIAASADVIEALELMCSKETTRLMVLKEGNLAGIITLKDLLNFFSLKVNLDYSMVKPLLPSVVAASNNVAGTSVPDKISPQLD